MPINVASNLQPRPGGTYYLVEDIYVKGGYQVRADHAQRDAIPKLNKKAGMLCLTLSDNKVWQLDSTDAWKELSLGGGLPQRADSQIVTPELATGEVYEFVLPLGRTVMVHSLSVSNACIVEAFSTIERDEENPYMFVATPDHLSDDGTSYMSDGTVQRNRRYALLSNLETSGNSIYFRLTNQDTTTKQITFNITTLRLE